MTTIIGTHSGSFHADDVFAVAALSILFPDYEIRRSRDELVWQTCDYLVDVGGVYDHEYKTYDHHFRNGPVYPDGLPMSSIGLVWKHYGEAICGGNKSIANRVCRQLIRCLDANDNGVAVSQPIHGAPEVCEVSISGVIAMMNPADRTTADEVFAEEVKRARTVILSTIAKSQQWYNSRSEVIKAVKKAKAEKVAYIEISEDCKWMSHLFSIEGGSKILYAIYPHGEQWYMRTVPSERGSFENRKDLPKEWRGLSDDEFSAVAGVPDGIFCHHGRFICAAESHESIIILANKAIHNHNK